MKQQNYGRGDGLGSRKNVLDDNLIRELKQQNLKQFLEETEGIEFDKNGMGLCPFHDDHEPSLSVQGENGAQRWKCFSCGDRDTIIGWIMKKQGLEFAEAVGWGIDHFNLTPKEGKLEYSNKSQEDRIDDTYSYADRNEKECFQMVRLKDPKNFVVRRKENGEWIWNKIGINPILYRLKEMSQANEVWLTEGEKDVHTLEKIGFVATTWPFGVKSWKPETYAKEFKNKKVNICLDEDVKELSLQIASDLLNAKAEQVKVIYLPGLRGKEDVSDWAENHDGLDWSGLGKLLDSIVKETPIFTPKEEPNPGKEGEGIWAQTVKFITEELDHGETFTLDGLSQHLGYLYSDAENRRTISKAVGSLIKKGEVTKSGRLGTWKKAPAKLVALDLMPDSEEEYLKDFTMPLLGKDIKTARGDLLLISGFTSTGKTAIAINFVLQNQNLFPGVDFFSTQAGQVRQRIRAFKIHQGLEKESWKMKLYERTEDYAPIINPDNLTIIDFLDEKEGEYFKVGGRLSRIHDRIENQKGLVIVFMQKPPNRAAPYGSYQTHSYANLSIVLDDMGDDEIQKMKQLEIIKSKLSPQHEGKVIRYKIENEGIKLKPLTPLEYPSRLNMLKRRFSL